MLRFGNIADIDHATGLVKVELPEDKIVTKWLSVGHASTAGVKYFAPLAIGQQVAVALDDRAEDGVVIGAVYSKAETAGGSADLHFIDFGEGGRVEYDTDAGKLTVTKGVVSVEVDGGKITIKKGNETLGGILSDLIDQLALETHTAPSGPTSPPLNAAAYTAIKTRLNLFLG